jgi:hypothetical protein
LVQGSDRLEISIELSFRFGACCLCTCSLHGSFNLPHRVGIRLLGSLVKNHWSSSFRSIVCTCFLLLCTFHFGILILLLDIDRLCIYEKVYGLLLHLLLYLDFGLFSVLGTPHYFKCSSWSPFFPALLCPRYEGF